MSEEKKLIKPGDIRNSISEGGIKVGDRIEAIVGHPGFVCSIEEGETAIVLFPLGDIDSPNEIHLRHYDAKSPQGYAEYYRPGCDDYDNALARLNKIKGDYEGSVRKGVTASKVVFVEQLCDLVNSNQVKIGDPYLVCDSDTWEVVYNLGDNFADTFVYRGGGKIELNEIFREHRYFGHRRCKKSLGAHERGSKPYHSLLDKTEEEATQNDSK